MVVLLFSVFYVLVAQVSAGFASIISYIMS